MFDPISLAEQAKESYALHFMGRHSHKFRDVMARLWRESENLPLRDEFMKVRGPYLQALSIPGWSDIGWEEFARSVRGSLASSGVRSEVVEAMTALGFKRLHRFQEASIRRILDDKDTLTVAGTGRGKSESWLIPLFHFIVEEKLAGRIRGTKALLLYPTKALAQDQFRRIIGYLIEINKRLPADRPITVGILDRDTPYDSDQNKVAFLRTAFQFMDCPKKDTKEMCAGCPQKQVIVDPVGDRLVLSVGQEPCRREIPLEFVHLTRDDVRDGRVDIVLTNPDLLNFQLINVNNMESRTQLIGDPKFIVLDEVHTYSGLFGNFTAALINRLKLVRKHMGGERHELRFIASSATVANKLAIFQKLCGVTDDDCVVEEKAEALPAGVPSLPASLSEAVYDEADLIRACTVGGLPAYSRMLADLRLTDLGLVVALDPQQTLVELLLERIVRSDAPEWGWIRHIYHYMNAHSPLPHELRAFIKDEMGLVSEEAVQNVFQNFLLFGGLTGMLERRAHLFAWALDGYYKCPDCDTVYSAPVPDCKRCGHMFISRFAFCTHCGEEVVEGWACTACRSVYPMIASRNGEATYFENPVCRCDGHANETIRCIVHPRSECGACGTSFTKTRSITCPQCGAWTSDEGGERLCINRECGWHGLLSADTCGHCGGTDIHTEGQPVRRCLDCGHAGEEHDCPTCDSRTQPVRTLQWVCRKCGDRHVAQPPDRCQCGGQIFFLDALFQVESAVSDDKGHYYIPGQQKAVSEAVVQTVLKQTFQLIDQNWQVRDVSAGSNHLTPCQHTNADWGFDRFVRMTRTPENILATSSQFLLRSLLRENGEVITSRLSNAKMLTFSDSIRDMEAVNRNFNEPEREHFLEATLYAVLSAAGGRITLAQLVERALATVEAHGALVYEETSKQEIFRDLAPKVSPRFRRTTVEGMLLDLVRPTRRNHSPTLLQAGICNLWPEGSLLELSAAKREALAQVWKNHQGRWAEDVLNDSRLEPELRTSIRSLFHDDKVLVAERNRLYVSRLLLNVDLVGPSSPANWDPRSDRFISTVDLTLGGKTRDGLVRYGLTLEERAQPWSRDFTLAAYELLYSPAALLVSKVYKGDTKKEERRRIEFVFKAKPSLHHISSGPAMEVGVDIGNLNVLGLYGTPPNINAYLQRIGRAGRKSKRSLVFSVSKSNPIDYHYHRDPRKLIDSGAQPVPLTISNREVTRISLTWAVLDFIATKFWVPWVKVTGDDVKYVEATDPVISMSERAPKRYLKLTSLFFSTVQEVDGGRALSVLNDVVTSNHSDLRHWLRQLISTEIAADEADGLVDGVLADFPENVYGFVQKLLDELDDTLMELDRQQNVIQQEIRRLATSEVAKRAAMTKKRTQLFSTAQEVRKLQEDVLGESLLDVQQMTEQKRYAYSLRSVSNNVAVYLRKRSEGEEEQAEGTELLTARELGLALKEYYPAAAVLREEEPYIVTEVHEAELATLRLRKRFGDFRWACENCGQVIGRENRPAACPQCGEVQRIRRLELIVPGKVVIVSGTAVIQESPVDGIPKLTAQMIYRSATRDTDIKATYPIAAEEALPLEAIEDEISFGDFSLGFASVELATFVHGFSATYTDGRREPASLLAVCGEPRCGGVFKQGQTSFCCKDSSHDPAKRRFIMLGRNFWTRALVITVNRPSPEGARMAHTIAHGLRMALQKVAGVDIRQLGEIQLEDGRFLVYEDVEGGYGIVDLLRLRNDQGERAHLAEAIALVKEMVHSQCCDDGCPFCLMQYGCTHRNRTGTFAKQRIRTLAGLEETGENEHNN